jgi:hypothetical protein
LTAACPAATNGGVNRFAAYFNLGFAGCFTPQKAGGLSSRKL